MTKRGVTENHRGHDCDFVALENICRHAGAIADVVADVVSNGRRVPGVIFRDTGFNLTDEIRTDVRRLGIDAAADTHEQCNQRAAETETE